jgi:signal transduction histidine kinase
MTRRYALALGLVAALSLLAYLSLRETIAAQQTTGAIVNFSGVRRYTSQRVAIFCQRLVAAQDEAERATARREILASAERLERAHAGLLHGDSQLNLPGNPSPAVHALYFEGPDALDPLVRDYVRRARALAAMPSGDLRADDADLRWILDTAPGRLLNLLDQMVFVYQGEREGEIARLQRLETGVLAMTLAVLCLEALFIFRPMARRVAEEHAKLVAAEEYVRSILDHGYDGIATIDEAGRVEEVNPALERLAGRPRASIMARPFTELFGFAAPAPRRASGVRVTLPALGQRAPLDLAFTAMRVRGVDRTIAFVRESPEQLQRQANDLERRNQELDQFAYVASHDLKAPLRAIANLSSWIEEDLQASLTGGTREQMALLRGRVRRLEALIDGIHQYATASRATTPPAPVDTGVLLREIVEEHDQQRRFAVSLPADLPVVVADRTRLWQVFANLVGNAMKHHGGEGGNIAVRWSDQGGAWEFSVGDDGPGIAPEHHERIFTIFQTLEPKDLRESLGLGLALVKKIVREQGGDVQVDSAPGRGATFRFTWPKPRAEAA